MCQTIVINMGEKLNEIYTKKEVENYLNDLDNLIDTGHFQEKDVSDFTFYAKGLTLNDVIKIGREIIRQSINKNE